MNALTKDDRNDGKETNANRNDDISFAAIG